MSAARGVPNARGVRAALGAALTAALAGPFGTARAHAQAPAAPLAERVARAGDGDVRFRYAVRDGVCGDGARGIRMTDADGTSRYTWDDGAWGSRNGGRCEPGPARVTLTVRGGVPRAMRLAVGGPSVEGPPAEAGPRGDEDTPASRVVDLGTVPAGAAAAYLLSVAARADAPSPSRLLLGAVVADSSVVWPGLLGLARDERLPPATRRDATFWAGHLACAAVTAARGRPARADTADRDVRTRVVFALSQRPGDERAATLTRVAREDRDPAVRCAALFWLGQGTDGRGADARTLDLIESMLRGR